MWELYSLNEMPHLQMYIAEATPSVSVENLATAFDIFFSGGNKKYLFGFDEVRCSILSSLPRKDKKKVFTNVCILFFD